MKKKRKWFPGIRRYDVLTDANVDNEQQQQEGTSNVSSDQPSASSSSEILLPAPILSDPDIVSVMQNKQGVDLSLTLLKERKTRKRTRESILFAPNEVTVASGNKVVNSSFIQERLCKVGMCSYQGKLELRQDNKKLSETLIVHCLICKNNVRTFEISENVKTEKGNHINVWGR